MCPLLIIGFHFISKIQSLSSAPLCCSPLSTNIPSPILLYAPNLLLRVSHFPTTPSLVTNRKSLWNMASFQGMPQSLLREMWLNLTLLLHQHNIDWKDSGHGFVRLHEGLWHVHSQKFIISLTEARVIWEDRIPIVKITPSTWPVCKPAGAFSWLMIAMGRPTLPWEVPPLDRWSWMVQKSYVIHLPCAFQLINLVMLNITIFFYFTFFSFWFCLLCLI